MFKVGCFYNWNEVRVVRRAFQTVSAFMLWAYKGFKRKKKTMNSFGKVLDVLESSSREQYETFGF